MDTLLGTLRNSWLKRLNWSLNWTDCKLKIRLISLHNYHHLNLKLFNYWAMTYCCVLDSIADFMKNSATNKVLATNWESEYLTFYEWKNIVNVKNEWGKSQGGEESSFICLTWMWWEFWWNNIFSLKWLICKYFVS